MLLKPQPEFATTPTCAEQSMRQHGAPAQRPCSEEAAGAVRFIFERRHRDVRADTDRAARVDRSDRARARPLHRVYALWCTRGLQRACGPRPSKAQERARAAPEWTEAVTRIADGGISDEVYERARRQFSEKELVDLTLAVIAIHGWNRLTIAFHATVGDYQMAQR